MSNNVEIEKTYLAKYLPKDLKKCKSKTVWDIYLPQNSRHAKLRIRNSGSNYTITKKSTVDAITAGIQLEENISITADEFKALSKVKGSHIKKTRYYYPYKGMVAEIDVFSGKHKGLVLIDVEFKNRREFTDFKLPDFCLADVTEEEMIAGGFLCRQTIPSLRKFYKKFNYTMLYL